MSQQSHWYFKRQNACTAPQNSSSLASARWQLLVIWRVTSHLIYASVSFIIYWLTAKGAMLFLVSCPVFSMASTMLNGFIHLGTELGGSARDYFEVNTRDQEITIKLNLGQNLYLRTECGQTGVSELSNVSIADSLNFLKIAKKTPRKRIWNSQPSLALH